MSQSFPSLADAEFKAVDKQIRALSRRNFLVASLGTTAAFGFASNASAAINLANPEYKADKGPTYDPSVWYSIDTEGAVTVNIARSEMGQHIGTALAQIIADELEADWSKVRIIQVDSDPKWGMMQTGGSWSVWQNWPVFTQIGAAGRIALINAGAGLLNVAPDKCVARNGQVQAGGKSVSYGDIVKSGKLGGQFSPDQLKKMKPKPPSERRIVGKSMTALDIKSKTNGTARFGIDAEAPGMVYARPKMPPTREGSKVLSVDDSAAKAIKGYQQYLIIEDPTGTVTGWVLAIADSFYAAMQAAPLLKVTYQPGPMAHISEQDIINEGLRLIADPSVGTLINTGQNDTAPYFKSAKSTYEQTYTTGTVMHMQLEPVNALAFEKDGVLEIHTGNQWQSLILPILAKSLGRPESSIVLRSYMLGGAFGRRLNGDYIIPAAHAAKMLGKPVKLLLTRPDDSLFDSVRSASAQTLKMAFGDFVQEAGMYDSLRSPAAHAVATDGEPVVLAMEHSAAAGWPTKTLAPDGLAKGVDGKLFDPFAISGADHWYSVGALRVRAISNEIANQTCHCGYLRSVGPGWTYWAVESFIDEAAHFIKADPLAFRLKLLDAQGRNAGSAPNSVGGAKRQANVLRLAAKKAGWGKPLPPDTALGIASGGGQERTMPTWLGCVVQAHVDRKTGAVKVQKITLVVDAGTVVDPNGALAQTQGAVLWGLSIALFEGAKYVNGLVNTTNLDTYTPVRIIDVPELDISFVESGEAPMGLGEAGVTLIAPAIANAIYNAVGVRLRHLPMLPSDVRAALEK